MFWKQLVFMAISLFTLVLFSGCMNNAIKNSTIKYVALGDSYTVGEGASLAQSWPQLLTDHLRTNGVDISLVANPGKTGWTTQQAIDNELSYVASTQANFVTVLLGVNDYVQGVSAETFRTRFTTVLDTILKTVPAKRIVVVTIPDYSVTPTGAYFGNPATSSAGIQKFNDIIKAEAAKRNVAVVDIFALSQTMGTDTSLVANDGLHPSAKEYAEWEKVIYPVVFESTKA